VDRVRDKVKIMDRVRGMVRVMVRVMGTVMVRVEIMGNGKIMGIKVVMVKFMVGKIRAKSLNENNK
jgi:hypothetical protein